MSDWEWYRRLAPLRPLGDLGRGFAAEVADPLWFLGRQWQLGEHQGEDASSPVLVQADVSHHPIQPLDGVPGGRYDPVKVPTEVLVEAERNHWWTLGRRIRLGRAAEALLPPAVLDDTVRFAALPAPYTSFDGAVDGYQVFTAGLLPAAHPLWAEVPALAPTDYWQNDTLAFTAAFASGPTSLGLIDHPGGELDWFSVDADLALDPAAASARQTSPVVPSRLHYPGAPLPRWWQIEDGYVDIGGFPPDRSHFATLLLLEASVMHTDDWFTFPVPSPGLPQPSVGVVVTLQGVRVKDSFDDWWDLHVPPGLSDPPEAASARPWSLFRTHGLDRTALVVWPTTVSALRGPLLDNIVLGVDEDANLLWAVELRAEGLDLAPDAESLAARTETTPFGTREFRYLPSTSLPPHWHPYRIENRGVPPRRRFIQGLVADLRVDPPLIRPTPISQLLGGATGHELAPHAVPSSGLRLERRWALARQTTGEPALWVQRRRVPLFGAPVSFLRFDVLAEDQAVHAP